MRIDHDVVTGRFTCPWCVRELMPTRRDTHRTRDGHPLGFGDEYSHLCGYDGAQRPYVITPFPDHRDALFRNVRMLFPPVEMEEAA